MFDPYLSLHSSRTASFSNNLFTKMNFKICSAIYLVVLCVVVGTINATTFSISKTGVVTADAQCSNSTTDQEKEQCTLELCKQDFPDAFECKALGCKLATPTDKQAILDCVTWVCNITTHEVCGGIEKCENIRDNDPILGRSRYIICITKLFPKDP